MNEEGDEGNGEDGRKNEWQAQAIFQEAFKCILMRNLPLHVSVLQRQKKLKTPESTHREGTRRERVKKCFLKRTIKSQI